MSAQSIPLNIKNELSNRGLVGRLLVIVERVPVGGALSAGTNNQNGTWSLKVGELADLRFVPPEDGGADVRNLTVRILRYDEDGFDYASTAALFDIHVGNPDGAPRAEGPSSTRVSPRLPGKRRFTPLVKRRAAMPFWGERIFNADAPAES